MSTARDEITELLFCYAERIDAGDFEGLADLFTHAEMTFAGYDQVCSGRQEVLARYTSSTRRYEDDGTPKTKHVMTNVIVAVDELNDTATSRSYFTVLQAVPGALTLQPVIAGRYRNAYACTDGAWRFTSVHIIIELVGDLAHHMLFDLKP